MGYYQEIDIILNDIKELQEMVVGFRHETNVPEFIIRLAENKAEKIKSRLNTLKEEAALTEQQNKTASAQSDSVDIRVTEQTEISVVESVSIEEDAISVEEGKAVESIAPSDGLADTINELLASRPHSLHESLEKRLVVDVRKALSLNDRFRFQRELFTNDAKYMDKVLDEIGSFKSLAEVLEYLKEKFNWSKDNEPAMDFIKIVIKKFS
ncbi:MAG: hypothetical protein PHI48_11560 [Bacteroidales bacterium]|nr:hypothetical protein [Bacteroidales bacterium]MDD4823178.1 hypothetical protein [Bacteroidales bacterium]